MIIPSTGKSLQVEKDSQKYFNVKVKKDRKIEIKRRKRSTRMTKRQFTMLTNKSLNQKMESSHS